MKSCNRRWTINAKNKGGLKAFRTWEMTFCSMVTVEWWIKQKLLKLGFPSEAHPLELSVGFCLQTPGLKCFLTCQEAEAGCARRAELGWRGRLPGGQGRGMGAFCLSVQTFAKVGGGKGTGIRCAYGVTQSCLVLLRITWILSKGKESSKKEVKLGTMPSLKKDGKAIKVFPGS